MQGATTRKSLFIALFPHLQEGILIRLVESCRRIGIFSRAEIISNIHAISRIAERVCRNHHGVGRIVSVMRQLSRVAGVQSP